MEEIQVDVVSEILREIAKSGPLAVILFILLRDQMNKFDKFLAVLTAMEKAIAGNTIAVEVLSKQCLSVQTDIKHKQEIAELRRELSKSHGESGGGSMEDELALGQ